MANLSEKESYRKAWTVFNNPSSPEHKREAGILMTALETRFSFKEFKIFAATLAVEEPDYQCDNIDVLMTQCNNAMVNLVACDGHEETRDLTEEAASYIEDVTHGLHELRTAFEELRAWGKHQRIAT